MDVKKFRQLVQLDPLVRLIDGQPGRRFARLLHRNVPNKGGRYLPCPT